MFELSERVALITGGSRGIGRGIARALAAAGARVVVNYRADEAAAARVVAEIDAAGGLAEALHFDVADEPAVADAVRGVVERHGRLDILVNNAGISRDGLVVRQKLSDVRDMLAVNLLGAICCARAALRTMMKARFGRIIQISSVVGAAGNPGQAGYSATKAALLGFTRSLALEVASRGITVNAVAPGFIDTDLTADLPDAVRANYAGRIPVGRMGVAADVAAAVAFLASADAAYITGQVIHVNGGLYL